MYKNSIFNLHTTPYNTEIHAFLPSIIITYQCFPLFFYIILGKIFLITDNNHIRNRKSKCICKIWQGGGTNSASEQVNFWKLIMRFGRWVNWRCCSCTSSIIISEIIDLLLDIARLAKLLSSKLKYLNLQLFKSAKGKTLYFCCKLLKNQSSYKSLFWTVKSLPVINITGRKKSLVFVLDFHSILFFFLRL